MQRRSCLPLLLLLATMAWPALAGGPLWRNLLRNPSFEVVATEGTPEGWRWLEGRAKARLVVDDAVARSGRRSIKLVNPTPTAPHVYGSLVQDVWVRPGRAYVLSCYVRSAAAGAVWIGGGRRWQHRFAFPARADAWTRVVGRFTAEPDERRFTVRVNTDSPTDGVWLDDVMLEEGVEPTEFVMDREIKDGEAVLFVEPAKLGDNLLPNSSFESVREGAPDGWTWHQRNTDAALAVDAAVAHSGRRSLRITNGTAFGAHIYGMLGLDGGAKVKPRTTYTISAWVRKSDRAIAWIDGGTGWTVRCRLPDTRGRWQRVSETFVTGEDEASIPILIATENPTKGFWVDDVKLEASPYATHYVPPEGTDRPELNVAVRPAEPVASRHGFVVPHWAPSRYPPGRIAFLHRELWVDGSVRLPEAVKGAAVAFRVTDSKGKLLGQATKTLDLAAGATSIEFGWQVYDLPASHVDIACSVAGPEGKPRLAETLALDVVTVPAVEAELKQAEQALAALRERVARLEPKGLESRALATATVLENFIPYAHEDLSHGEVGRACDAARALVAMARRRTAECDAVLAGKHPGFPAVRYRTSPIAIEGPSFVADAVHSVTGKAERRPVFFMGYGHFGAVRRDIEKFPRYGVNCIQIEFGPRNVLVAEDRVDDAPIRAFLAVCDRAAKAGVSVNLLLSPHYFPAWALDKWPHLKNLKGGFLRFDFNAPEARQVIERFLRIVIPRVQGHPALHSLCLSNEPVCADLTKSEPSARLWHDWLRREYKTVAAMNQAWGAAYQSVDAVPVPADFAEDALTYDFARFNQEQFAAWHRWMADIIHQMAPKVPVHAKIMIGAHWYRHHHGIWSVSPELFGALSQIHGNDCWKFYSHPDRPNAGDWASAWLPENMGYDFQRSMGDKPVFNSENHLIRDRDFDVVPPAHIYNVLWQGAVHGMSASTTWVWERTFDVASDLSGSIMHRPDCTEAHNLASLDLNRLAREVTALQQQPPQVALLSSLASSIHDADHVRALQATYTAFNFCGVPIGFVTERQMAAWVEGGPMPPALRMARLLVVPNASHVPTSTIQGVAKFADGRGDRLVRVGACFTHTEHRAPRADAVLTVPCALWPLADAETLWPKCREALAKAGVKAPAEVVGADGKPVWGIEVRAAEVSGRRVVNLASYRAEPQQVRLLVDGKPARGTD
ncbi:beta-galactosidase, partial [bacterium]|nr:beta-galactosidase [bacterium]